MNSTSKVIAAAAMEEHFGNESLKADIEVSCEEKLISTPFSEQLQPASSRSRALDLEETVIKEVDVCIDVENLQANASRLIHLACKFDSVASLSSLLEATGVDALDDFGQAPLHYAADEHAARCVEYLLKRRAKTDIKSRNGYIPLECALHSQRLQISNWSVAHKINELLALIGNKDLTPIRILAGHTKDVLRIAAGLAVQGNLIAFTALLSVTGETMLAQMPSSEEHGGGTLLDIVVKKAITLGGSPDSDYKEDGCSDQKLSLRQMLLKETELLLHLKSEFSQSRETRLKSPATTAVPSLLIRAVQAGDIEVASLLLKYSAEVNETDSEGNTPLHWCLRTTSNTRDIRFVWKLLKHGASITLGNRLGLSAVHIAAGQGHLEALQLLLAVEPPSVHAVAETKETPLFSAVRNNQSDCVQLLLQHGASRQVLNLRKQRPVDVAITADMRALLSLHDSSSSARMKNLSFLGMSSVSGFDSHKVLYETEHLKINDESFSQFSELNDESPKTGVAPKTEICRYFGMPGGCVRGDKCFYAHGEEDLQGRTRILSSGDIKLGPGSSSISLVSSRMGKRESEDLSKKIFIGGLSPSVESDDLREYFEEKFGPVLDAIVIGSHSGDHMQSRGFGFVTFKHEDSVLAAVQAHYVNIFGKKVEIKGAVPRCVPTIEITKGVGDHSKSNQSTSRGSPLEDNKINDSSFKLFGQANIDPLQAAEWIRILGCQTGVDSPHPLNVLETEEENILPSASSFAAVPAVVTHGSYSWVIKFKQWLPKFLAEVSNRLQEGEWYPLSSLKGDFRATCGLELDHVSLGYHKLSDFVRSMPDLCRMKIVPVGRGPATHMVLLPALTRLTPPSIIHPQPFKTGSVLGQSLVDVRRSYAAAAGQGQVCSLLGDGTSSRSSASIGPQGTSPIHLLTHFDPTNDNDLHADFKSPEEYKQAVTLQSLGQKRDTGSENLFTKVSVQNDSAPKSVPQEDISYWKELFEFLGNDEGSVSESQMSSTSAPTHGSKASPEVRTPLTEIRLNQTLKSDLFSDQPLFDRFGTADTLHKEEPRTPVNQIILKPFSTFSHPFAGFLPRDSTSTQSSWEKQPQSSSTQIKVNNQQMSQGGRLHNMWLWNDSPQSILFPYSQGAFRMSESGHPLSLFSPVTGSPLPENILGVKCAFCGTGQAIWVAIPCNHPVLCAVCKDAAHPLNHQKTQCLVCQSYVERWIALH